jgi:tetratricopeptide (TPR) repeat protein
MGREDERSVNLLKNGRGSFLVYAGLAVVTLAVYWPVRHFEFVNYDDDLNVSDNRHVQQGLTVGGVAWAFTTTAVDYWRPLTWLTHMLDWQLYGPNAGGHHLTNVFLHVVNTLLLFAVWNRMTGRLWPSALLAGLFALHPLHVGSVAWVTERKDVLSGLFWMLALLAYARYVEQRCLKRYLQLLLFFALGLMAKPMIMTLPFVLLLLDVWPLKRMEQGGGRLSELILEKVPLLLLTLASTIVTYVNAQHAGQLVDTQVYSLVSRIANALVSYVRYLGKTLWPVGLSVYYPLPDRLSLWVVVGAALLLTVVSLAVFRERQRRPYLVVGWLWYLGTLLPVIGLIQGRSAEAMADRYTYLPLTGIFMMVAWGLPELLPPTRRAAVALRAVAVTAVFALMVGTWHQLRYWRNSVLLFERALAVTIGNYVAHNNLGLALMEKGRVAEAGRHFQQAVELWPEYPEANKNLADILAQAGRLDEAVRHYHQALERRPRWADAENNLGSALAAQGQLQEAVTHFSRVLQLEPESATAQLNLGLAYRKLKRPDLAVAHLSQSLALNPNDAQAHCIMGLLLKEQGRQGEAAKHFEEALRLNPNYAESRAALKELNQ